MKRIHIVHTTGYRYAAPVTFGLHRLVVRPREGHDVQIEHLNLGIRPAADVTWHRDLFGNSIAYARFSEPSDYLEFCSEVTLCRGEHALNPGLLEALPVKYPVLYSSLEQPLIGGYLAPVYPAEADALRDWLLEIFPLRPGADAVSFAQEIGLWIFRNIQYRRREDRGVQTPQQTLELKSGSCRDMATLMLEAVRTVGLASRFASGYLNSTASAAGRAATHAWTEIYFPDHGWFGFDPTIGEGTSHKHIVTGVSSHPRGVMPISGAYSGPAELYAGMTVSVKIDDLPLRENEAVIHPS